MNPQTYSYRFNREIPWHDIEDTFLLALLAVEGLHGRTLVQMEARFKLDKEKRSLAVDINTQAGSDLAKIFTCYITREYGDKKVTVKSDIKEVGDLRDSVAMLKSRLAMLREVAP